MFDWGDIPIFLALARHRTTGRAATALGCSQPTVVRRIAQFERATGLDLFVRDSRGVRLTEDGRHLLESCVRAAGAMQGVVDCIDSLRSRRDEQIRVTVLDQWEGLLTPVLRDFRTSWPGVEVRLETSYRRLDVAAGEADMALRAGVSFPEEEVLVRPMPDCGFGIYVSADLDPSERPSSLHEVGRLPLAGGAGVLARLPSMQWFETLAGEGGISIRCNYFAAVRSAILDGAIGLLPCVAGGSDRRLIPLFAPIRHLMVPLFLGVRRDALRRPAVKDLFERLTTHIREETALIVGDLPPAERGSA